jgi:glycosyltransferase involved in cell wall biosynthesis
MAALDVLASPSHGEAFSNVLGEAMACEVPCVVTDVGDSAEIVGQAGRVVSPGDMAGLARNILELVRLPPEFKVEIGRQARNRVASRYEIGHITQAYERLYEQVAQGVE